MKNNIALLLVLFFLSFSIHSSAQSWERTFLHSFGLAKGFDVIQTSDNGYVMVGEVDLPTGAIRHYIWLVKTDIDGNQLWSKVFDAADVTHDAGRAIIESSNGDLFIAGFNNAKASVMKTNANGEPLWVKNFGGLGRNAFQDIALDAMGNLILVGQFETTAGSNIHEVWAMGMNTAGDSLWSAKYLQPSDVGTTAMDISPLPNNDFLVTGSINGQGFSMKIDGSNGAEDWSNTYQLGSGDFLFSGAANDDMTSLLIGGTSAGVAGFSPILFETDLEGVLTNPVEFLSVSFGVITSLAPTTDAGFILTGSAYDFWSQSIEAGFITKLDNSLEVEWELTYEDSLDKQGTMIKQNPDGSYILAGSRQGGMWLKRIEGTSTPVDDLVIDYINIKVYPNPASNIVQIELPEKSKSNQLSISIYDTLGKLIKKEQLDGAINSINVEQIPRGAYHYTIQNSVAQLFSGKIVLQ